MRDFEYDMMVDSDYRDALYAAAAYFEDEPDLPSSYYQESEISEVRHPLYAEIQALGQPRY